LLRRRRQDSSPIVRVHQRPGEQASGTVVFSLRSCTERRRIRLLGSARATALEHLHLRPDLGDRSRDFTAYIFLHQHRTTTSTEVLPRLVWLIQRDNGTSVAPGNRPAFGYILILLWFYLFITINLSCLSSV
jgi:hypothetical protein